MKKLFWLILIVIVIFGVYLRLVNLDKNPPHLGSDEVSVAYDSFSMRTIGKDEHGNSWPLSFESHGDYKAPLYTYVNMPINYLLGNNEWGARVLSLLASIVAIVFIALIGKEISGDKIGLLAALIFVLNPKNITASRIGYESNLAATMVLIGFWSMILLLKKKKNIYAIIAGLFLGLSIWGYHTERGLVPILMLVLPWLARKELAIKKWILLWLVLVVVASPMVFDFVKVTLGSNNNRVSTQLWFKGPGAEAFYNDPKIGLVKKTLVLVSSPIENYLEHFSFNSNFTSGTGLFNQREPMDVGWFLIATLPILIIGLFNLKKIFGNWWKWLVAFWLICPIVPALTFGGVASVRNLVFIFPTTLIMAGGLVTIISKNKKIAWGMIGLILINFLIFSRAYYVFYPKTSGNNFQFGYKQAWEFIKPDINKFDRVVVEDRFGEFGQFIGVPHLYFGYFGAFTVEEMQQRSNKNDGLSIGKYIFKYVDWNKETYTPKTIYIVSAINPIVGSLYSKFKQVEMIRNTDFKPQFLIYETIEK